MLTLQLCFPEDLMRLGRLTGINSAVPERTGQKENKTQEKDTGERRSREAQEKNAVERHRKTTQERDAVERHRRKA